jgi:hypothetical protein
MFRLLVSGLLVLPLLPLPASTADFTQFIASLWPEAQAAGVCARLSTPRPAAWNRITNCRI